jgi:hypothetical protein
MGAQLLMAIAMLCQNPAYGQWFVYPAAKSLLSCQQYYIKCIQETHALGAEEKLAQCILNKKAQ